MWRSMWTWVGLATIGTVALQPQPAAAATYKVLYNFCSAANCTDGAAPHEDVLLRDSAGNLFGTTSGPGKGGTVFEFALVKGKFRHRVLWTFCRDANCIDGWDPRAGLIMDAEGDLYGTTRQGGKSASDGSLGHGTVFELVAPAPGKKRWQHKTLYSFCSTNVPGCPDGEEPEVSLSYAGQQAGRAYDRISPLYGTTSAGGMAPGTAGLIYQLTPGSNGKFKQRVAYPFCSQSNCTDGADPWTPLLVDASGNFYGTTLQGCTCIYEISPAGKTFGWRPVYTFTGGSDGATPNGPVFESGGDLVGSTLGGGANSSGVIYDVDPKTSSQNVLYSFCVQANCTDGQNPIGRVLIGPHGDLFGVTANGGANSEGVIYKLSGSVETVLENFCDSFDCRDGIAPNGDLVSDGAGHLFGTAQAGGSGRVSQDDGAGVLFEMTP